MQRRSFIRLVGGGVVLAAGTGALSIYTQSKVPGGAVAAWQAPSPDLDIRRWVLSYALLAPNPHNLQPWLADVSLDNQITLRLDPKRRLPATDPFGRQIMMGAGAFLELLKMAASAKGYAVQWQLFPEGYLADQWDDKPFARVQLSRNSVLQADPLFEQVLKRRTDRRAYDPVRAIEPSALQKMQQAIDGFPLRLGLSSDQAQLNQIRHIAREAWRIELTTEAPMMESMHLLRIGRDQIEQHRDGISITSPMLVGLSQLGMLDTRQFPAPDSQATQGQLKNFEATTASTPAYFWLVTEGNSRAAQIEAGRAYARLNLVGTALGLAMHPNQQALQEYPEVQKQYKAIHDLLQAPSPKFTVQMLARVGYLPVGTPWQEPAPRRGLAAHLTA